VAVLVVVHDEDDGHVSRAWRVCADLRVRTQRAVAKDTEQVNLIGYRPEGRMSVAWAKGYKLGVIASSDHFSTHISYAMVYTGDPTRKGILDAIRKRHTYGATDNIILEVRMGDHSMGDEFQLKRSQPIRVKARGTRPIVRVEVLKDSKVIYSTEPEQRDV
jgi:hypothetical protein